MRLFSHWLILVSIFCTPALIFASKEGLGPTSCTQLLTGKPFSLLNPIDSFNEHLPALISRFSSTHKTQQFDVRILSDSLLKNTFSPSLLRDEAVGKISDIMHSYTELGFQIPWFTHVLVEAHPGAVGIPIQVNMQISLIGYQEPVIYWDKSSERTPFVGGLHKFAVGVPFLFGHKRFFTSDQKNGPFAPNPAYLVLTAVSPTYHSIQDTFTIAHELGHLAEPLKSIGDQMWREARADFLAYAVTGKTDIYFPEGYTRQIMHKDGTTEYVRQNAVRSISQSSAMHIDDVWPAIGAYHHNSQILSSALYEISQNIGLSKALALIRWMDEQRPSPALLPLTVLYPADFTLTPEGRSIGRPEIARVKIFNRLFELGQLIRTWSTSTNLSVQEQRAVLEILRRRGINF